jgi:hypothetical protein
MFISFCIFSHILKLHISEGGSIYYNIHVSVHPMYFETVGGF